MALNTGTSLHDLWNNLDAMQVLKFYRAYINQELEKAEAMKDLKWQN